MIGTGKQVFGGSFSKEFKHLSTLKVRQNYKVSKLREWIKNKNEWKIIT